MKNTNLINFYYKVTKFVELLLTSNWTPKIFHINTHITNPRKIHSWRTVIKEI